MGEKKLASDWAYIAVRKGEKGEYIDFECLSHNQAVVLSRAESLDARIPHWAKDNKLLRVAKFKLVEDENA